MPPEPPAHRGATVAGSLRSDSAINIRGTAGGRADVLAELGQFLEQMHGLVVVQGMDGVEPQSVQVVVGEPLPDVVGDEGPHLIAAGSVEVDRHPPGRLVPVGEVRAVLRQVVAGRVRGGCRPRPDRPPALFVGGVDEALQSVRTAVGLVHRVQRDPVVPPPAAARKGCHRHDLDDVHPEFGDMIEMLDGGVEGALGGEGADVQLVDHGALELLSGPVAVGPGEGRGVDEFAGGVHAVGLPAAARIGHRLAAVEAEGVASIADGGVQ